MAVRRWVVGLWVAAAVLVAGCGAEPVPSSQPPGSTSSGPATVGSTPGSQTAASPVVDERLRFTARTVAGGDFDGASLAGRPAVLWFWAPWCPKCRAEAPGVAEVARDSAGTVTFVGVAAQDEVPAMQRFVDQYGVDFTHLADTEAALWRAFGVTVQPAYAFVSADGSIEVVKSQLGTDDLAGRVAALR